MRKMIELYITSALSGLLLLFIYFGYFYKPNIILDTTQATKSPKQLAQQKTIKNRQLGELPPVYPNGWFALLESTELKKGEVKHVAVLGQNFAVFRTEKGHARVMDAYCPHLGANMAEDGAVRGEELECPFHIWRFCGETGKCTSIPYTKTIPSNMKVKVWESVELNGVILVWYHAESTPPNWYPKRVNKVDNGTWVYQGRNEFFVNSHVQDVPENGSDWAHLSAIHVDAMLPGGFFAKIMRHRWRDITWHTKTSISRKNPLREDSKENDENEDHIAVLNLKHDMLMFEKLSLLNIEVEAFQTGPGYVEICLTTSLGPVFIVETITPLQPLLQRVTHRMYAPFGMSPYCRLIIIGETIMFQRDVEIWNKKKFIAKPMYVNEDKNISAYRRWFKQFYSENSPTYESTKNFLDW